MKNTELLFFNNPKVKNNIRWSQGRVVFDIADQEINGKVIGNIISRINGLEKAYHSMKVPISFQFGNVNFKDKLTYIILECIMFYLISEQGHDVRIFMNPQQKIDVEGIFSSPLMLLNSPKREKRREFVHKFKQEIYMKHFRKIVKGKPIEILDEINYFLKFFEIDDQSREDISEVFAELISNGTEHGADECLVDIDVTDNYHKLTDNEPKGNYYGINIVVLNLSEGLLSTKMRSKILQDELTTERYQTVRRAYEYHSQFFSDKYCEEDFFNIASFQDRISGRTNDELTGGTGLTLLIKSLEQKADTNFCYVLSGKRALRFRQEYIEYNSDNWLGFNGNKDFLTSIPELEEITDCDIYFPGTAYNLNFIMEKM